MKTDEEPKKTDEEPKKKPSGIPLICGSLNWDLMGREKSRVNSSMKNIFPCFVRSPLSNSFRTQQLASFNFPRQKLK